MPKLPQIDSVSTAAEALARARAAHAWRQSLKPPVKPMVRYTPPPPPPAPQIAPPPPPRPSFLRPPPVVLLDRPEQSVPLGELNKLLELSIKYFGLSREEITGGRRSEYLCMVRHVVMYLMATCTGNPLTKIGRVMHKDHTTVIHGCRRIETLLLAGDQDVMTWVEAIKVAYFDGTPLLTQARMKKKPYSPFCNSELARIREMALARSTYEEIAAATGRSVKAVITKVRRMGLCLEKPCTPSLKRAYYGGGKRKTNKTREELLASRRERDRKLRGRRRAEAGLPPIVPLDNEERLRRRRERDNARNLAYQPFQRHISSQDMCANTSK